MEKGPIVVTVSLALLGSIALAPAAAAAERFHGGAVGGGIIGGGRPVVSHPIVPHGFFGHPIAPHGFFPHPFFPRPFSRRFIPFGVFAAPVVVYAPPVGLYGFPTSYDPPAADDPRVVYGPSAISTVSVVPLPAPGPNVIEYPTGRYELRGDGVTTPYTWVWIPNPPPPPPPAAPPAGAPVSGDPSPSRHGQLYRWTDEQGVVHLTDRGDAVPTQYRTQANQTRS